VDEKRAQLAEHLRLFGELGASGVSRDARWRARDDGHGMSDVAADAAVDVEIDAGIGAAAGAASVTALGAAAAGGDPQTALEALRAHIGPLCTRCKLGTLGRKQVVFGVGDPRAALMFVGEGPGADEDQQGEPFVGRAGQLLTKIIEAINLTREQVYIANVVKCRPPGNRAPEPDEVATCLPFLRQQIQIVRPKVIVALGASAVQALLATKEPISRLRGRILDFEGAKLVPTFHPAFLLRSPERKRDVWEDMKKVRAMLIEGGALPPLG